MAKETELADFFFNEFAEELIHAFSHVIHTPKN